MKEIGKAVLEQLNGETEDRELLTAAIIEAGRRLYLRGMVAANDGNISCRLADGSVLITRTGVSKGFLSEEDILLITTEQIKGGELPAGCSMETGLHLALYAADPQVYAVVHAHPPYAAAYALAEKDLNEAGRGLEDIRLQLGQIALLSYAPAGTPQLAANVAAGMAGHRAGLMLRHGAVAVGGDLKEALYRMEVLEQAARIVTLSRSL